MHTQSPRWWMVAVLLFVVAALVLYFEERWPGAPTAPTHGQPDAGRAPASSLAKSAPAPTPPLVAERILEHYADPARPPEEDLVWMARALENFALLAKGDNPLPLGANEDIANALRGKNRVKLRALPDQHPALNAQGQLIDRWGTPLYFHARSRDRLDIRSAGPDREMWTADDLHRLAEGRFLRGPALLAPSLFDPAADSR